jgi:hypothetical protein
MHLGLLNRYKMLRAFRPSEATGTAGRPIDLRYGIGVLNGLGDVPATTPDSQ